MYLTGLKQQKYRFAKSLLSPFLQQQSYNGLFVVKIVKARHIEELTDSLPTFVLELSRSFSFVSVWAAMLTRAIHLRVLHLNSIATITSLPSTQLSDNPSIGDCRAASGKRKTRTDNEKRLFQVKLQILKTLWWQEDDIVKRQTTQKWKMEEKYEKGNIKGKSEMLQDK